MTHVDADRNVLIGLLAVRNDLISPQALTDALRDWAADKSRPLEQVLLDLGAIDRGGLEQLDAWAEQHRTLFGDDARRGIRAIDTFKIATARERLDDLSDDSIRAALALALEPTGDMPAVPTATGDGRYRVVRPLAAGGLGKVSIAFDESLRREVALKEIRDVYGDIPLCRSRFLQEAEITGGLEHPGIVPVYGLGRFADGRPFYAMRLIRGESLRRAIARFHALEDFDPGLRSLELRQLLARFVSACNAVAYAHSKGVLHRDLKPDNIMLGDYGEALVVDWGLAKPLDHAPPSAPWDPAPDVADEDATQPGSRLGTPGFMSPEQERGDLDRIGPASDVFSLGATLACLLTGHPPRPSDVPPSTSFVTDPGKPRRPDPLDAPPALAAICRKAMAPEIADRYESARALAADIERWLADEPVTAWREPWPTRARRRVARHRTAVVSASAAALVGVVGLVAMLVVQAEGNRKLTRANLALSKALARERAAVGREQAANRSARDRLDLAMAAIGSYYTGASEDVLLRRPGLEPVRDRLLRTSLEFYQKLTANLEAAQDADRRSRAELAAAYNRLADVSSKVGSRDEALRADGHAAALWERLVRDDPADRTARIRLAQTRRGLGSFLTQTGHPTEAIESLRLALDGLEQLAREDAEDFVVRAGLAEAHADLGTIQQQSGALDAAVASFGKAIPPLERIARERPKESRYAWRLSQVRNNLGLIQMGRGRLDEALTSFRAGADQMSRLSRLAPDDTKLSYVEAGSRINIGLIHQTRGDLPRAAESYGEGVAILQRMLRAEPNALRTRRTLGVALNNLGTAQSRIDKEADALTSHESARAIFEGILRQDPGNRDARSMLAVSHEGVGNALLKMERAPEALASARLAVAEQRAVIDQAPQMTFYRQALANHLALLGDALRDLGRPREAVAAIQEGRSLAPADAEHQFQAARELAHCSRLLGDDRPTADAAIAALRRAILGGTLTPDRLRSEPKLDPLRPRDDFQLLLQDLAFPPDPFAP